MGKNFTGLRAKIRFANLMAKTVAATDKEGDAMRKYLIIIMILCVGMFTAIGLECFAADEI